MKSAESVLIATLAAIAIFELVWQRMRPLKVLLLGAGPFAALAAREIEKNPQLRHRIIGLVEEDHVEIAQQLSAYAKLGTPADLAAIVEDHRPDRILVALADRRGRLPALDLLQHQLRGVMVEEASETFERLSGKLAIETLQPGSQLFKDHFQVSQFQENLARFISLSCALVGFILFAPLMALAAIAIKATSPGPVLFRQRRIGLGGRPFELLKFRTMRQGGGASEWVTDNTNRITAVGALLRRTRMDELPQFVNLIRGDMNLVGPRPHPVSNHELFNEQIPFYALRCLVRPGLTGWAQIRYRYANNLAEETEKMRYDLYYIKHRSAWMDLQIIPATFKAIIAGHGATGDLDQTAAGPTVRSLAVVPAFQPRANRLDWVRPVAVAWGKGALAAGKGAMARVPASLARAPGVVLAKSAEVLVNGTGAIAKGSTALVKGSTALVRKSGVFGKPPIKAVLVPPEPSLTSSSKG
jgi:exopolysaccharide biosynthesis polyprenyl glycosylphosphotransferase